MLFLEFGAFYIYDSGYQRRTREMILPKKIAVINMKGGVGKSTVCVNLAWHYSAMRRWLKKVLLIDLDPQFNASQYILGVRRYQKEIYNTRPTVWDIFEQATRAPGLRSSGRKLTDAVFRAVEFVSGSYIDLIPSQLELSYSLKNPSQKEHLLANFVHEIEGNYDLVLIDCAPTESILTTAAYLCADQMLIPVKPEFLSTIGLPLIRESMAEFTKLYRKNIKVSGVCFNNSSDYAPEAITSKAEVKGVCSGFGWHVFPEEIPFSRSFPKGAREGAPIFKTSYAHTSVSGQVARFCDAFAKVIGL
jgi:chromosome partitioning protein